MECTACGKDSEQGAKVTMTIFGEKTFFYCSPACVKKSGHSTSTKNTLLKMFEHGTEAVAMFNCPQCGEKTETLYEGYCEECRDERQNALNEHNAMFDFWEKCTDAEKDFYIRSAAII